CGSSFHSQQSLAEPDHLRLGQGAQQVALVKLAPGPAVNHRMAVVAAEHGEQGGGFHAHATHPDWKVAEDGVVRVVPAARQTQGAILASGGVAELFGDDPHAATSPTRSSNTTPLALNSA